MLEEINMLQKQKKKIGEEVKYPSLCLKFKGQNYYFSEFLSGHLSASLCIPICI
jgi:hypothetical protein